MVSIFVTIPSIHLFFKCLRCFELGRSIKLYRIGIIKSDSKKMPIMLREATMPNSFKILLFVKIKVAKPDAVVRLVIKVAFPIFVITRWSDLALFPCLATSSWYLLMRKIQLGIPITIIKGGIRAVKTVISKRRKPNTPKAHITPISTTNKEIKVALNERKKRKKMKEVRRVANTTNKPISSTIFCAFNVRT